jgi:hypothetical protein
MSFEEAAAERQQAAAERQVTRAKAEGEQPRPQPRRDEWPDAMAEDAFHGLAGDVVRAIESHSEADPVALLAQFLVAFGNAVGNGPYYLVEGDRHRGNLFVTLVGATAKARKGTSWGRVRQLFERADDDWLATRVHSGLSSGEGVIYHVRDGTPAASADGEGEPGVTDKRLMIIEPEFAGVLHVMERPGNTLSRVLRDGWDRGDLATLTKNDPTRATGALISIIAHITAEELRHSLTNTDVMNGFANRFLFVCVRRARVLPHGGALDGRVVDGLAERTRKAIDFVRTVERVEMDRPAKAEWESVYPALSEGRPGLFGAAIARAEAQTVRLALLYALLDGDDCIRIAHLRAALAVWEYAEASARHIFGDATGVPLADRILTALREAGEAGMTRTQISATLGRNIEAGKIDAALASLVRYRLGHTIIKTGPGGRGGEVWRAGGV